jgi:hypothetical protein
MKRVRDSVYTSEFATGTSHDDHLSISLPFRINYAYPRAYYADLVARTWGAFAMLHGRKRALYTPPRCPKICTV